MPTDDRLFGIDVSQYQGVLNWDEIGSHIPDVAFAGIRAGISWGYTDKWFNRNWVEAKRVGIPRTAYHVFYPLENVDAQVNSLVKTVGSDIGELPITADIELHHGASNSQFSSNLKRYLEAIEKAFGRRPIIYSRASFIDPFVGDGFTKPYGNSYKWWMAHYWKGGVEMTDPPAIPRNVDRSNVIIHQNGDRFKAIGGVSSSMDFNRWLKSVDEFNALCKGTPVPLPPTPPQGNSPSEYAKQIANLISLAEKSDEEQIFLASKMIKETIIETSKILD